MLSMPKVAMKGGRFSLTMNNPLTNPNASDREIDTTGDDNHRYTDPGNGIGGEVLGNRKDVVQRSERWTDNVHDDTHRNHHDEYSESRFPDDAT